MRNSDKCGEWHILGVVDGVTACVDCGLRFEIELAYPLQIARVVAEDV